MELNKEKFNQYVRLYNQSNDAYYPDKFISIIHSAYIDDGFLQLPNPLYAIWDITEDCNLSCSFCSAKAKFVKSSKIKKPKVIRIAEKILSAGIQYVSIRGGEPSLVYELPKITKFLLENGIYVEIVTNGFGIDNEFFSILGLYNNYKLRIKISLDCDNRDINDSIRGKGSYDHAISAMKCCVENKAHFRVQMVICRLNKNHIVNMYNLCNTIGAFSFGCLLALPMGRGVKSSLLIDLDNDIIDQLIYIKNNENKTIIEKIGIGLKALLMYFNDVDVFKIDNDFDDAFSEKIRLLKCNAGKTRIYISKNGDVYPCELLQTKNYFLGNIICDGIEKIWSNDILSVFNKIRRTDMVGCNTCKNKQCNTGCYALYLNNIDENGYNIPNCRC